MCSKGKPLNNLSANFSKYTDLSRSQSPIRPLSLFPLNYSKTFWQLKSISSATCKTSSSALENECKYRNRAHKAVRLASLLFFETLLHTSPTDVNTHQDTLPNAYFAHLLSSIMGIVKGRGWKDGLEVALMRLFPVFPVSA
jgi:hypothetical protein